MSDREQKIRERAHAIWLREGQPHGQHDTHWHLAADEIAQEQSEATEPAAASKAPAKPRKAAKPAVDTAEKPARRLRVVKAKPAG